MATVRFVQEDGEVSIQANGERVVFVTVVDHEAEVPNEQLGVVLANVPGSEFVVPESAPDTKSDTTSKATSTSESPATDAANPPKTPSPAPNTDAKETA